MNALGKWDGLRQRVAGLWRVPSAAKPEAAAAVGDEQRLLLQQLRSAHLDWVCARQRLDHALGHDEVDYAIFTLEAAEKRYGILLKQAKTLKVKGHGLGTNPTSFPREAPRRAKG